MVKTPEGRAKIVTMAYEASDLTFENKLAVKREGGKSKIHKDAPVAMPFAAAMAWGGAWSELLTVTSSLGIFFMLVAHATSTKYFYWDASLKFRFMALIISLLSISGVFIVALCDFLDTLHIGQHGIFELASRRFLAILPE